MKLSRQRIITLLALVSILIDALLVSVAWGTSFLEGMYCALGLASTVGCDSAPHDTAGKVVVVFAICTSLPLVAAVFSMATSTRVHTKLTKTLDRHHEEIKNLINGEEVEK